MQQDKQKTKVRFYIEEDGEILAVFPEIWHSPGFLMCYARLGQHSAMHPSYTKALRRANKKQAAPLREELTRLGYKF